MFFFFVLFHHWLSLPWVTEAILPVLDPGPTRSFYHRAIKDEIQYTVDGIPIRSIYVTNINMDVSLGIA